MYAYISSYRYDSLEKSEIRIIKFDIMIGAILGLGTIAGGAIANAEARRKQFSNEKELMGLQAIYNKEAAAYSQKLQKEMWDYTNYSNQVKHMKEAGLNPALLYGMSGGGGSTAGSAQAAGVSNPGTQAVGMGLEAAQLFSNIRLTNAEASKAEAEAEKTSGVDTELTKAQTELATFNATLANEKGKLTREQVDTQKQLTAKLIEETKLLKTQAEIAEETKENEIQKSAQELQNMMWDGLLKTGQIELTEAQKDFIKEQTEVVWYNAISYRRISDAAKEQAYAAMKKVVAEIKKWNKELDQKDEQILQDWLFGSADAILELGDIITDLMPTKRAGKIIETVFTEDNKGNWKSTRSTRSENGTTKKGR